MPDFYPEMEEYEYILFHSKLGQIGREYIRSRGLSPHTAKYWHLGYSPENYTPSCYEEFKNKRINKFWKKLNGRLIIPIFDQNGNLLSLSGRGILPKMWPKYDHYPFPAKRTLFGLFQNKGSIREENLAIITEGQIDVISAWQKGIRTVISSFGAHTGQEHFALLGRYTNNIFVLFDSDAAGDRGAKNTQRIKKADLNVKECIGLLPKNLDLDNWVKTGTKEELYNLLNDNKRIGLKQRLELIRKKGLETGEF